MLQTSQSLNGDNKKLGHILLLLLISIYMELAVRLKFYRFLYFKLSTQDVLRLQKTRNLCLLSQNNLQF